jgi:hypothetical protein
MPDALCTTGLAFYFRSLVTFYLTNNEFRAGTPMTSAFRL